MLSVLSNDFGLKNLRKLVSLKKIPEIFGIRASTQPASPPKNVLTVVLVNCKKIAVKHSLAKSILFNFMNLFKKCSITLFS